MRGRALPLPLQGVLSLNPSVFDIRFEGIIGAHEDRHGVYDTASDKWRLILCERHKKYQAGMWESDHWDRDFKRLFGPVEMDSSGTMIQTFGSKRFALFGSSDRKIKIRTYPDLEPAGELKIEMPPWHDDHGTRIWPTSSPFLQATLHPTLPS